MTVCHFVIKYIDHLKFFYENTFENSSFHFENIYIHWTLPIFSPNAAACSGVNADKKTLMMITSIGKSHHCSALLIEAIKSLQIVNRMAHLKDILTRIELPLTALNIEIHIFHFCEIVTNHPPISFAKRFSKMWN